MDTKAWGPDGWNLLHSIAVSYPDYPTLEIRQLYQEFFESIALMLPCIYCRNSFTQYLDELPLQDYLQNSTRLSYWLYLMHHKVNDKLANQGVDVVYNHNFPLIHQAYQTLISRFNQYYPLKKPPNKKSVPVWGIVNRWGDIPPVPGMFLVYCILFNYPREPGFQYQQPRRYQAYQRFFYLLAQVTPFRTFQQALFQNLETYPIEYYLNSDDLKKWAYLLEISFCQKAKITKHPSFAARNKFIEQFRATCNGKTDKMPTCHASQSTLK